MFPYITLNNFMVFTMPANVSGLADVRDAVTAVLQKKHLRAFANAKEKEASPHLRQGPVMRCRYFIHQTLF